MGKLHTYIFVIILLLFILSVFVTLVKSFNKDNSTSIEDRARAMLPKDVQLVSAVGNDWISYHWRGDCFLVYVPMNRISTMTKTSCR